MLSAEHTGHWYDPELPGQGFEIHVLPSGRLVATAYLARIPGYSNRPAWVSFQGRANAGPIEGYVPRLPFVFGEDAPPNAGTSMAVVGEATFTDIGGGRIAAVVTIDLRGVDQPSPVAPPVTETFELVRLI